MNTYNTGNPVGSTNPKDLLDNASNFDEAMNSSNPTFTDRLGVQRDTWSGQQVLFNLAQAGRAAQFTSAQELRAAQFQEFLESSGYQSLGNYASGIEFTAYNQYIARGGFFYRPAPSAVPFVTTGTWEGVDEDLFVLFPQEDILRQDLNNNTDPTKGAQLVGFLNRSIRDAFLDMVHITYFVPPGGLAADGVDDWQQVFEDAAASSYGSIYVPPGKYLLSAGNVDITEQRFWSLGGKDVGAPYGEHGALIYTTQTTNPVFILGDGGCIDGLQFFYPNQDGSTITDVSGYPTIVGAPIVYPPTIKGKETGISGFELRNLVFLNAYHCIELGDPGFVKGTGRGTISHIDAFALKHFLTLHHCLAEIIVSDFVLSPITFQDVASTGDQKLRKWVQQNAEHFVLARADGLMINRGTALGANINIRVKDQFLSLVRITDVLFDQARTVLKADHNLSNVTFSDCQVFGGTIYGALETPADLFRFDTAAGSTALGAVIFNNVNVQSALGRVFSLNTSACVSSLTITDCELSNWASASGIAAQTPALYVDPAFTQARITIADNHFRNGNLTYGVGIDLNGGAQILVADNRFTNNQQALKTSPTSTLLRVFNNTSENTQGSFSTAIAGNQVSERGNKWDKPQTSKVSADPWFIAVQTSGQSTSGTTPLTMLYQTRNRDGDSSFVAGTGTFTCKTPGAYDIKAVLTHAGGTAGDVFNIELVTTLSTYRKKYTMIASAGSVDIGSPAVDMRVGDTAFIRVTRASGTGVFTTSGSGAENFIAGRLID